MGYAVKDQKRVLSEKTVQKIDLSVLDESSPEQHQIKLLFICGIFFGFWGNEEHVNLEVWHFNCGTFDDGHKWAGIDWLGIEFITDKTHKLSINKSYVRSAEDTNIRLPAMDSSENETSLDPGGCIQRFLDKLAPGQMRIYCKVVPEKHRGKDKKKLFYGANHWVKIRF